MTRLLLAFLVALLLGAPALAQSPVEVTADTFVVDQAKSEATFTGNVVITRADLKVWADKVLVTFGKEGLQNIRHITATGNVRLKTETQEATGERASFDPSSQIMRLTGNVTVVNASGTLNGPELVVDLANQTSTFTASGGGRVTGIFTPE
jgi:lipopolysaccharide export system protein LptA